MSNRFLVWQSNNEKAKWIFINLREYDYVIISYCTSVGCHPEQNESLY